MFWIYARYMYHKKDITTVFSIREITDGIHVVRGTQRQIQTSTILTAA